MSKTILVDEHCPNKGDIVEYKGNVYSCCLNQTDIKSNKNKFYIMQLIKNGSSYVLFTRWGRLGEVGSPNTASCGSELEGVKMFEKQFKAKTGNNWGTSNFVKKEGKYFMSEVSYEDELKGITVPKSQIPDSKLPDRVQKLLAMLTDVNMMNQALVSLDIDTKKMPLGKIKASQLDKANEALIKIQQTLDDINKKVGNADVLMDSLNDLSSFYYTLLPMAVGRRKPPVINSNDMIQKYKDIIDELKHIVVTVQITDNVKVDTNPLDSIYDDIHTKITPLDKSHRMWDEIHKYIANTHGPTHGCKLEIMDIFEVEQAGKRKKFDDYCTDIGNRTLLFHGSGLSNWISIMKNDLLLNPQAINTNVVITGKMFGNGIYFADSSKSFGYTRAYNTNDIGCYALTEVALGNQLNKFDADYYINKDSLIKTNKHSTKGEGRWQPSTETIINENGYDINIPNGKLVEKHKNASLRYNEYIVYDSNQLLIRYLIILKNNGSYDGY